tara:strand:- start:37 stop:843 length:807 start_codon:yes stop_codon:yes gene_type:complete
MTNQIFKRTYRIAFHPNVVKMIDGAREGTYAYWGFHDLLDHTHEDEDIMVKDTALISTFKKIDNYKVKLRKRIESIFNKSCREQGWDKRTVQKMIQEENQETEMRDIKRQEYMSLLNEGVIDGEQYIQFQRKIHDEWSAFRKRNKKELKAKGMKPLYLLEHHAEDQAYEELGYPEEHLLERESVWQPVFDRGYWEVEYISADIPDWILEREYSISHEEPYNPEVEKLETKKGHKVNWKSRNRGGSVRVSSKKFRQDTKEYPTNLDCGV